MFVRILPGHAWKPRGNGVWGIREVCVVKLYIMADVSRISGVLWGGLGVPPWYGFPSLEGDEPRLAMTELVNGAVRGARAAGVSECVIHEACPLYWPTLEDASVVRGGETLYLDDSFAGIAFVGQGLARDAHSRAGVETNLEMITWNGRRVDELTMCALYAGALGVPTVMVHGQSGVLEIIRKWLPDVPVAADVESGLQENLRQKCFCRPVLTGEVTTRFRFRVPPLANFHVRLPGVSRVDPVTTETRAPGVREAFAQYCSVGLVAVADWLKSPLMHPGCRE